MAPPIDGGAYAGAVAEVERRTQPGDQILVGPQLTWLYVFTDRSDPLKQLSLLPGSLGSAADEEAAIARMDGVKLAVIDRKPLKQYGHGAFGETFDKRIMAWLERDFERVATVRGDGADARAFDIWARSGS
jgi:hypothetical protein